MTNSKTSIVKSRLRWTNFLDLCHRTQMFEYGPVKGTILFTPKSTFIWETVQKYLNVEFRKLGVKNVYFPSLIPIELMAKETDHISGFKLEFFYVYSGESINQKKKLILRPTSEAIFSYYFQKKLTSYRDLPILLNQWANVWRVEKNSNPFLRNTEFLWQEGHTIHATQEEAILFCQKIWKIYQDFFQKYLLINIFIGNKSELEKFAGANQTWTVETLLPDGQFLQLATVHFLDTNFSKGFDISFKNKFHENKMPFQTSWGLSTRIIAGLIKTHADENGLLLPIDFVDNVIVILPILNKNQTLLEKTQILSYSKKIYDLLQDYHPKLIDVQDSKKTFAYWCHQEELIGTPIRIEIGKQELIDQKITYVLRTSLSQRSQIKFDELIKEFPQIMINYHQEMIEKINQPIKPIMIEDFSTYKKAIKNKPFKMWFCNRLKCEIEIKQKTQTVSRCLTQKTNQGLCFNCQEETHWQAIFGRSY